MENKIKKRLSELKGSLVHLEHAKDLGTLTAIATNNAYVTGTRNEIEFLEDLLDDSYRWEHPALRIHIKDDYHGRDMYVITLSGFFKRKDICIIRGSTDTITLDVFDPSYLLNDMIVAGNQSFFTISKEDYNKLNAKTMLRVEDELK